VLTPYNDEMRRLMGDPAAVDAVLRDGADRAAEMAAPILAEVQDIVGFLRP
jgi:tryptophanyl-tRNA synthetase